MRKPKSELKSRQKNLKTMKNLMLIILFSTPFFSRIFGQDNQFPIDPETKKVTYQEVIEATGINKDTLYSRALDWIKSFYDIVAPDKSNALDGEIFHVIQFGLVQTKIMNVSKARMEYTVTGKLRISVKDGRARIVISDLMTDYSGLLKQTLETTYKSSKKVGKDSLFGIVNGESQEILLSFKDAITTGILKKATKKKDDW